MPPKLAVVHTLNGHGFDLVFNLPSPENFMNRSTLQPTPWKFLFFEWFRSCDQASRDSAFVRNGAQDLTVLPSRKRWKRVENGRKWVETVEGGVAGFRPLTRRSSTVHTEATRISLAETT